MGPDLAFERTVCKLSLHTPDHFDRQCAAQRIRVKPASCPPCR